MTQQDTSSGEHTPRAFCSFNEVQEALSEEVSTVRQHWLDTVQSQYNLTVELMSRLANAHTLPDLVGACQDSAAKRGSLIAEEGRLFLNDYQRCATTATKCLFNGFMPAASS